MRQLSFKRHRFSPEIIRHSVWPYTRFTLSFRDVEEMLAERGLDISHETVRRWFLKFGSAIAANLRRSRSRPSDHWHLDEMVIVIRVRATPSIFSATSSDDPSTKNFEPHHSMFGKPRVLPPDHRSLPPKFPAAKFM